MFSSKRDYGNCLRCKTMLKAGQSIEKCKVSKSRNIFAYKHANSKDCIIPTKEVN